MNRIKKQLALLAAFSSLCIMLNAQSPEKTEEPHFKHAVGIGAGFSTGYGLSYRYHPTKFGVQANFAPYHDDETDRISAGLTFLYTLIPGKTTSLYLYQGNHYFYNSETRYYNEFKEQVFDATPVKTKETESYFINGIGLGMEIVFAKRIGFNLMTGYGAYKNFSQVNITGETGLYFKF